MKALSGLQPWWWWITDAPEAVAKRIENRVQASSAHAALRRYREPFLLHASAGIGKRGEFDVYCNSIGLTLQRLKVGSQAASMAWAAFRAYVTRDEHGLFVPMPALERGGIVGRARCVGLITPAGDPYDLEAREAIERYQVDLAWHIPGQWGHILADVEKLPFRPCKGALGLWEFKNAA